MHFDRKEVFAISLEKNNRGLGKSHENIWIYRVPLLCIDVQLVFEINLWFCHSEQREESYDFIWGMTYEKTCII